MHSSATTQILPFFVYGTLMVGQPNDYLWQDSIHSLRPAYAPDSGLLDLGFYPILVQEKGLRVKGQLIHVLSTRFTELLRDLDALEGFDPQNPAASAFRRIRRKVRTEKGHDQAAWLYSGHRKQLPDFPLVADGDWARHAAAKLASFASWREAYTSERGTALSPRNPHHRP